MLGDWSLEQLIPIQGLLTRHHAGFCADGPLVWELTVFSVDPRMPAPSLCLSILHLFRGSVGMRAQPEKWSVSQEEEENYRRSLFKRAKKGEAKAKEELWATYGVRLYTEGEKAGLVYEAPPPAARPRRRKTENHKTRSHEGVSAPKSAKGPGSAH